MTPDTTDKTTDGMLPAPACSPSSTPETSEAWAAVSRQPDGMYDSRVPISEFAYAMSEHSKKMERERNALAEALKSAEHAKAYKRVMKVDNQKLKQELSAAISVISTIEERYSDGCDTYEDWKFMGDAARKFLSENK